VFGSWIDDAFNGKQRDEPLAEAGFGYGTTSGWCMSPKEQVFEFLAVVTAFS
jgi:hypothetical protein